MLKTARGIHRFPFRRKVAHLRRRRFVPARPSQACVDAWCTARCRSCGRPGLAFYLFRYPAMLVVSIRYYGPEKFVYRSFVLCHGCGHWKDVSRRSPGAEEATVT